MFSRKRSPLPLRLARWIESPDVARQLCGTRLFKVRVSGPPLAGDGDAPFILARYAALGRMVRRGAGGTGVRAWCRDVPRGTMRAKWTIG